ncbi:MAG: hypothetical protein JSW11_02285 [Candidatus Heimdallarchaeota archaeon]|nr:MAG: hypothetical protein JSW11_02285 [Candidatus Heimdallarchaeota archaeon]
MKVNENQIVSLIIGILTIHLLVFPVSQGSATIVWEETFNSPVSLDDWELIGVEGIETYGETFDPNITWVNGTLAFPFQTAGNTTFALHHSAVAYGTWSFDLFFPPGGYSFIVTFIFSVFDGNYIPGIGTTSLQYNKTGYALRFWGGENPSDQLYSFFGDNDPLWNTSTLNMHSSLYSGSHHFDITRGTTGQFYVYHNQDYDSPIISYQCNFTASSEKFGIWSWVGAPQLDNITVSDTVDIPEPVDKTTTTTTTTTTKNDNNNDYSINY